MWQFFYIVYKNEHKKTIINLPEKKTNRQIPEFFLHMLWGQLFLQLLTVSDQTSIQIMVEQILAIHSYDQLHTMLDGQKNQPPWKKNN